MAFFLVVLFFTLKVRQNFRLAFKSKAVRIVYLEEKTQNMPDNRASSVNKLCALTGLLCIALHSTATKYTLHIFTVK